MGNSQDTSKKSLKRSIKKATKAQLYEAAELLATGRFHFSCSAIAEACILDGSQQSDQCPQATHYGQFFDQNSGSYWDWDRSPDAVELKEQKILAIVIYAELRNLV